MKNVQKLVLVPVERWEKIGDNIPVKQVSVTSVIQKNVSHPTNPHFPGDESEVESEKSERFRETTSDEKNSDVSFSHSGEEEESN